MGGRVPQGGDSGWRDTEGTSLLDPNGTGLNGVASDGFVVADSPKCASGTAGAPRHLRRLPDDFAHPVRADLATGQHLLRRGRAARVPGRGPADQGRGRRGRDLTWAEQIALPDRG